MGTELRRLIEEGMSGYFEGIAPEQARRAADKIEAKFQVLIDEKNECIDNRNKGMDELRVRIGELEKDVAVITATNQLNVETIETHKKTIGGLREGAERHKGKLHRARQHVANVPFGMKLCHHTNTAVYSCDHYDCG